MIEFGLRCTRLLIAALDSHTRKKTFPKKGGSHLRLYTAHVSRQQRADRRFSVYRVQRTRFDQNQ